MASEKKSLVLAKERAKQMSLEHPGIVYRVMNKPRKQAVVTASDWIYRERVLDGWTSCCRFANGRLI